MCRNYLRIREKNRLFPTGNYTVFYLEESPPLLDERFVPNEA